MSALLGIGEFSRMTHVSVKALRHYADVGLLEPADVDPASGYRFYATAQVPTALLIRRFRDLDMPLDDIRAVLEAPDLPARDEALLAHLQRLETKLAETQASVVSLTELLEGRAASLPVEHRRVPPMRTLAVRQRVTWNDAAGWLTEALDGLHGVLEGGDHRRTGPDGALYPVEFFEAHAGDVVAFVPVAGPAPATAGARLVDVPGAEVAVIVHHGPFGEIDKTYAALGTYVAEGKLGAEGPIREHYLDVEAGVDEPAPPRTEVCWPILAG